MLLESCSALRSFKWSMRTIIFFEKVETIFFHPPYTITEKYTLILLYFKIFFFPLNFVARTVLHKRLHISITRRLLLDLSIGLFLVRNHHLADFSKQLLDFTFRQFGIIGFIKIACVFRGCCIIRFSIFNSCSLLEFSGTKLCLIS